MTIKEQVNKDYIEAYKAKDIVTVETLKLVKAKFLNLEKEGRELKEEDYIKALSTMAKQREEAATIYDSAGDIDRFKLEVSELKIIHNYLPQQISRGEVISLAMKTANELNLHFIKQNMGKLVKEVLSRASGATDGKMVSSVVQELLNQHTA